MDRASRRRLLRLLALALGLPLLAVGPLAYAAANAPEVPTISFTATGAPPVVCGTRPNVTNLVIKHGTRVIIANRTGVAATLDIGRRRLLELPDGTGARVRLMRGQHDLRMIPQCAVVSDSEKAAVSVMTASQMRDLLTPRAAPDGGQNPPDEPDVTIEVETSSTGGAATFASPGSSSDISAAQQPERTVAPSPALDGREETADIAIIEGDVFPLDEQSDPKGLRLVGAIATICVLGVSAAIIRAIVSERTSRSVG
jgi:hypothetical protein